MFRRPRLLAAAAAAALVSAAGAAPAGASLMSDCDTPRSDMVFMPWLDTTPYFLAPDGGFEHGAAGWRLDGASVGAGNEAFNLSGPGTRSLHLGAGDSATSPAVCVGLEHPTFRFVARKTSGLAPAMSVAVVDQSGLVLPLGVVAGTSSWQPSPILVVGANLLPTVAGGDSTQVRFRFTPISGTWQVDDLYVDPRGGT
jgi:hypothetical protein